jgi:hypothetical protein
MKGLHPWTRRKLKEKGPEEFLVPSAEMVILFFSLHD